MYTVEIKRNLEDYSSPVTKPVSYRVAARRRDLMAVRQPIGTVIRIVDNQGRVVNSLMTH